ncbi:MAG: hypothetical protein ACOYMP_04995 [Nodosilinea sp.]
MTENNPAEPTVNLQDQAFIPHGGDLPGPGTPPAAEPWETVNFPDQFFIEADRLPVSSVPGWVGPDDNLEPRPSSNGNTEDLITLIQDLNQCNDALLARVGELEEYLERSQTALQSELERSQSPTSHPPVDPASIAQLLQELDIANDGLRRTTIHNETLQAEVAAGQQRIAQMEREFTLLQQRFSEKSAALVQAEESCRDLKSRLHRQQHYTLQFKAALEKCLNTGQDTALPLAAAASNFMPRSGQIKPWSALPGEGDRQSHLRDLFHNLKDRELPIEPAAVMPEPFVPGPSLNPASPLGDQAAIPGWGAEAAPAPKVKAEPEPLSPTGATPQDPWQAPPASQNGLGFTEPSPWGAPLAPVVTSGEANHQPPLAAVAAPEAEKLTLPHPSPVNPQADALTMDSKVSPSPVVYPLRSPKKISSLAAVQLPSFGRSRPHS